MTKRRAPEAPKRNVDDVPYVQSADLAQQTPMREILRERKRRVGKLSRALREAAYRERAGIIGIIGSCMCTWPLQRFETESEHADWCVANAMFLSAKAARATQQQPTSKGKRRGT